jgi:hypothetical protein
MADFSLPPRDTLQRSNPFFITPNIIEIQKSVLDNHLFATILNDNLFGLYDTPKEYGFKIFNNLCRDKIEAGYVKDKFFVRKQFTHLYLLVDYNIDGGRAYKGKYSKKNFTKNYKQKNFTKNKRKSSTKTRRRRLQNGGNNELASIIKDNSLRIRGFMITNETHNYIKLEVICVSEQTHTTHRKLKGSLLIAMLKNKNKYIYLNAIISAVPYYLKDHDFLLVPHPYNPIDDMDRLKLQQSNLIRDQAKFKLMKKIRYRDLIEDYSCGVDEDSDSETDSDDDDRYDYGVDEDDPFIISEKRRRKRCKDDGFDMIWIPPT